MSLQMLPWTWSFDMPVILGIAVAVLLYVLGVRYSIAAGLARHLSWWRMLCFGLGLVAIFLALQSPLDAWADSYLWAHMVQHILLIFLAAPLLLFGAPLMPVWRAFPLEARRSSLRWLMVHPRPRRTVLAVGRFLGLPRVAWFLFVADFIAWHTSGLYDLALRNQPVHDLEHLCFLGTALLFWGQVIPSAPLRPRLSYIAQAFYVFLAGMATELVSLVLIYSGRALYSYYAQLPRPAGAISPLTDQVSAAALMNIVGLVAFGSSFMLLLWLWIEDALRREAEEDGPGTPGTRVRRGREAY